MEDSLILEKPFPLHEFPALIYCSILIVFRFRLSNRYVLRNGVLFHVSPFLSPSPGPGSYTPPVLSSTFSRGTTAKPSTGKTGRQVRCMIRYAMIRENRRRVTVSERKRGGTRTYRASHVPSTGYFMTERRAAHPSIGQRSRGAWPPRAHRGLHTL